MSVVSICYVRFCAGIRASKAIQKYSERVDEVLKQNRLAQACSNHFYG